MIKYCSKKDIESYVNDLPLIKKVYNYKDNTKEDSLLSQVLNVTTNNLKKNVDTVYVNCGFDDNILNLDTFNATSNTTVELDRGSYSKQYPVDIVVERQSEALKDSELVEIATKNRTKCPEKWKVNIRKRSANSGLQYVNRSGKVQNEKRLGPLCQSTCKLKCFEKFDLATRQRIHAAFWNLADRVKQWNFINRLSKQVQKRRCTTDYPSRRQFNVHYFLPPIVDNEENNSELIRVCRTTFLNTLSTTERIVRTAHLKFSKEGYDLSDNRGRHRNRGSKSDCIKVKSVCDHVMSLQPIQSQHTKKLYLDHSFNITKMFLLYKEWDQIHNYKSIARTLRQYRGIVGKHMRLTFLKPN